MFENLDLFCWTLVQVETPDNFPRRIHVEGQGPYIWPADALSEHHRGWLTGDVDQLTLVSVLIGLNYAIEVEEPDFASTFGTLVVGRTGWSEARLTRAIEQCAGQQLKVYSEEMLVSFLLTGCDPFDEPEDLLLRFANGHPALEHILSLSADFDWPTTVVSPSFGGGNRLHLDLSKNSLPGILGYRVGKSSPLSATGRHAILDRVLQIKFTPALHNALEPGYLDAWGDPGTPERLHQLAVWLAAMCTLEKKRMITRGQDLSVAIKEREDDLQWLKSRYYQRVRFRWPSTNVEEV